MGADNFDNCSQASSLNFWQKHGLLRLFLTGQNARASDVRTALKYKFKFSSAYPVYCCHQVIIIIRDGERRVVEIVEHHQIVDRRWRHLSCLMVRLLTKTTDICVLVDSCLPPSCFSFRCRVGQVMGTRLQKSTGLMH